MSELFCGKTKGACSSLTCAAKLTQQGHRDRKRERKRQREKKRDGLERKKKAKRSGKTEKMESCQMVEEAKR